MTDQKRLLLLIVWPLAAILLLCFPFFLSVPLAIAFFCYVCWNLLQVDALNQSAKTLIFVSWLLSIAAMVYALIAFGEQIGAADMMQPAPLWTTGLLPALITAPVLLIIPAAVAFKRLNQIKQ